MLRGTIRAIVVLAVLALLALGVYRGINTRIKAAANVKQETIDMSVPTVSVVDLTVKTTRDTSYAEISAAIAAEISGSSGPEFPIQVVQPKPTTSKPSLSR